MIWQNQNNTIIKTLHYWIHRWKRNSWSETNFFIPRQRFTANNHVTDHLSVLIAPDSRLNGGGLVTQDRIARGQ